MLVEVIEMYFLTVWYPMQNLRFYTKIPFLPSPLLQRPFLIIFHSGCSNI